MTAINLTLTQGVHAAARSLAECPRGEGLTITATVLTSAGVVGACDLLVTS
jgi:hypothetical protein